MKISLLSEVMDIKKIMGLLKEDTEVSSQSSDLSKVQNLLKLEGLEINAEQVLDDTEPICIAPKKLSNEDNQVVSQFWDWANSIGNKNNLRKVFNQIKTTFSENQNGVNSIELGNLSINNDQIKRLGETLITITVVGMVPKTSNCKKS